MSSNLIISTTSYDADSRVASVCDALGNVRTYTYDNVGRVVSIQYNTSSMRVTYQYDKIGRRTTMIDSTGTTTYTYTARNELSGKTDSAGHVQSYKYDWAGNRTTLTDPNGAFFTYVVESA